MLSSFFGRKPTNKRRTSAGSQLSAKRDGVLEKKVMEGADRELYRYNQPEQELGMSDLIKNHESGTRFMYAAVTGKETEEMDSKLRRLISFQPKLRRKAIPVDNLPVIKLYRETENFPLSQLFNNMNKKGSTLGDYVRVSDAVVLYGAVVSPDCHFTKVNVGISDTRLLSDKVVKSFTATTNMMSKGNLALPYCVPRDESECLTLTISRERAFLEEGRQWGAIQIELVVEFTDFPMQYSNQPVAAVNMLPSSALETPPNNPNNIDISILNQDKSKLANLYLEGEIADENEPIENKTAAIKYAKSSIAGASKGKKIESATPEWNFLSSKRVGQVDQDQVSVEPSEEGSVGSFQFSNHEDDVFSVTSEEDAKTPKKSAMKKPPTPPKGERKVSFNNNIDRLTPF